MLFKFFAASCVVVLLLSGCTSSLRHHGYPELGIGSWDAVEVGKSRKWLVESLGAPVITAGDTWMYPSCKIHRIAAAMLREYECNTLKVKFDERGLVSQVDRIDVPLQSLLAAQQGSTKIAGINDGIWRRIESLLKR